MLPARLKHAFSRYYGYAHLAPEEIEYRTLALSIVVLITLLDFTYNLAFYLFGEPFTWWTTATYVLVTASNLYWLKHGGSFSMFRNVQLAMTIALPLAAQIMHGGFTSSSGVLLAAFLAPLGALMFASVYTARVAFFAYIAALLVAGIWELEVQPARNDLPREVSLLFFEFNFGFTAAIAYFLMEGFLKNKRALLALVRSEHQKAQDLLLEILPAETARELQEKGRVTAKSYAEATVMFTDFVGFSAFARQLPPGELVELIDYYFRAFDAIVQRHGVEKIKTIGDSYMCAGGLPVPDADHACRVLRAALEIRDFVLAHREHQLTTHGYTFDIRIGLHTGSLVAGVVGSSKIAYDIWGETVNLAARVEQSGEPNRINISAATYALVQHEFDCVYRGRFPAKHVGEIELYDVVRGD
jgi:class 3 adenylate cyclase